MGVRAATIDHTTVEPLERTVEVLSEQPSSEGDVLSVALGRLTRVTDEPRRPIPDRVIDLAIGLEAALAGDESSEGISLRLRTRAAAVLAHESAPPTAIYDDTKALYCLRSAHVHGSAVPPDRVSRAVARVAAARLTTLKGEQFEAAIDRWKDLLRRAILLRLALSAGPAPPWPVGVTRRDIVRLIADHDDLAVLRGGVVGLWDVRGLGTALSAVAPLEGLFGRRD